MATTSISIIPKDVFERGIIRMTEGGIITMPNKDVWMTVDEIADMLFVSSAIVFRTIRSIYIIKVLHVRRTHMARSVCSPIARTGASTCITLKW